MSDKEKISAFLDDDLSIEELGSLALRDVQNGETRPGLAMRYQLIGDAMRGEVSDASLVDVSAQVREDLRNIIPDRVEAPARQSAGKTSQSGFDFSTWFAPFMRPLGGLAVAASVALVTVIAITQVDSTTEPSNLVAEAGSQKVNIPAAVVARPVAKAMVVNVAAGTNGSSCRAAAYLDTYLTEHAEFAAQDTMQGRMPYARAVSYESE